RSRATRVRARPWRARGRTRARTCGRPELPGSCRLPTTRFEPVAASELEVYDVRDGAVRPVRLRPRHDVRADQSIEPRGRAIVGDVGRAQVVRAGDLEQVVAERARRVDGDAWIAVGPDRAERARDIPIDGDSAEFGCARLGRPPGPADHAAQCASCPKPDREQRFGGAAHPASQPLTIVEWIERARIEEIGAHLGAVAQRGEPVELVLLGPAELDDVATAEPATRR